MSISFPVSYVNGDYQVTIKSNGTKTVEGSGVCEFPETIDLKVTNKCNAKCGFCHENSVINGKHASLEAIQTILDPLPNGVELAIGGGNPLVWPHLEEFLQWAQDRFICNITVNGLHVSHRKERTLQRLEKFQQTGLIYGLGVSSVVGGFDIASFCFFPFERFNNVIGHLILGRFGEYELKGLMKSFVPDRIFPDKDVYVHNHFLILGYKEFGRGVDYVYDEWVQNNIQEFKLLLPRFFYLCKKEGITICFDNLAIEQLELNSMFAEDMWNSLYMGAEGTRSMYIDGVEQQFARSSTSVERISATQTNVLDFFKGLQ